MSSSEETSALSRRLGISQEAAHLYLDAEVIDLHIESLSWTRSFGYSLSKHHRVGWNRALLFGQADFPRLLDARIRAGVYSITANPLRPSEDREASFRAHVALFRGELDEMGGRALLARNYSDYEELRAKGTHAAFLGVQGANALPSAPEALARCLPDLIKVSLLHLTNNEHGRTSTSPRLGLPVDDLSTQGARLVEQLENGRVLVDLAHLHPGAIPRVLKVAKKPALVSHTGMDSIYPHFRNLSDENARAIAERGGVIGLIYHSLYLGDCLFRGKLSTLVRHIVHALSVAGEDHVALGSDWDGLICTPRDMPTCLELPRLVEALTQAGIEERVLRKILGLNFLRLLREVRP